MRIVHLDEADSTNTYVRHMADAVHGTVVVTSRQTAGRGQRGNTWESDPGKNLTFSMLIEPHDLAPINQYAISEATAVGVAEILRSFVPEPECLSIKWPNDIYYHDRKLCGILIENSISGNTIDRSILGIGINVNQRDFFSDAPNPVSLWQITHADHDLDTILGRVCEAILLNIELLDDKKGQDDISMRYHSMLWRRKGYYPYRLPGGDSFDAEIISVAPTGHISLRHTDGTVTEHAFKEVFSVIKNL